MIRLFPCAYCERGKVTLSYYGGNDPDTWDASEPCEECDGHGNDEVDDEGLLTEDPVIQHDPRWYQRAGGRAFREYRACSHGCIGFGISPGGAVRDLIESLADRRDNRAFEQQEAGVAE